MVVRLDSPNTYAQKRKKIEGYVAISVFHHTLVGIMITNFNWGRRTGFITFKG
jgi:hypothetical protein